MKILTISGSSRNDSNNSKLLDSIPTLFPKQDIRRYETLDKLPLFKPESDQHPWPEEVLNWRKAIGASDAIIVCTPEYIYNLPALLKNALEWVTTSGELSQKPVLAITFTPHPPRGEKAMQSLIWSLQALDARVVAQLPLYQNELKIDNQHLIVGAESLELLKEGLLLLGLEEG